MKKALIIGIMGQDGAYLSKNLLEKGYKVYGGTRRSGSGSNWRLKALNINKDIEIIGLEILEYTNIQKTIERIKPDEVYNLAAQSFVATSFEEPSYTGMVNGISVSYILEAIKIVNPQIKFYQASTSEMYGKVKETPQNEETPFYPRSPYGVSKLYAHWLNKNYRESYNMFCCNGILFNHESPLRGEEFVTRKITMGLSNIKLGKQEILELGNINSQRDWGFAGDYVEGMYLMMQQEKADDFVLATGKTNTIKNFIELAAKVLNYEIEWNGKDEDETGIDKKSGKIIIKINRKFYRPAEVDLLIGDSQKANKILGWKPKVSFEELIKMMVESDYNTLKQIYR